LKLHHLIFTRLNVIFEFLKRNLISKDEFFSILFNLHRFQLEYQKTNVFLQHDDEQIKKIEVLSKKLEDLLEEHFGNLDFDNITGSPGEDSSMQLRFKTSGQKLIAGRYDSTKKSISIIAEDSSLY